MFQAGFTEVLLVFVIGLLILGPERLPKVAAQIGRWVGRARRTASHLRHQLEREVALAELEERRKAQAPKAQPPATPAAEPAPAEPMAAAEPKEGAQDETPRPGSST
jgi:sec-independent protein translocase protein TatB